MFFQFLLPPERAETRKLHRQRSAQLVPATSGRSEGRFQSLKRNLQAPGISALRGCAPTRLNFALCAAMIGWGGVSVHMQTAAAVAAANVKTARHLAGRALSAALSALYALAAYALI